VVAHARALRARGWTYLAIAAELGVPRSTVGAWGRHRRRTAKPVRIIVTRAKSPS
jgi:hypothetical protein